MNNTLCNNYIDYVNPDDYIVRMFGRYGWICRLCKNFNFNARMICNRCHEVKAPKLKKEMAKDNNKKKRAKKIDWVCLNCHNINYSFRKFCNICQIERKPEFPLVYYIVNKKINNANNKIMSKDN